MSSSSRSAVLITGGARRIGKALASAFADDGFDIALHFNNSLTEAGQTAEQIRAKGVACELFQADLNDARAAQEVVSRAFQAFPRLNVLVHSASLFIPSGFGIEALPLLERHMDVHVRAAWAMGAVFSTKVNSGVIVHLLDTKITVNKTSFAAYLLSKKTLAELVKMTAVEFAPANRVNAVAPGFILPPEGAGALSLQDRLARVPLQRKGELINVTDAVRFLVRNDYITGQTIFVDGGEHLL